MFGVLDFVGRDFIQRLLRRKVFWEKDIAFVPLTAAAIPRTTGRDAGKRKGLAVGLDQGS